MEQLKLRPKSEILISITHTDTEKAALFQPIDSRLKRKKRLSRVEL